MSQGYSMQQRGPSRLLLGIVAAAALSACGGGGSASDVDEKAATASVELTVIPSGATYWKQTVGWLKSAVCDVSLANDTVLCAGSHVTPAAKANANIKTVAGNFRAGPEEVDRCYAMADQGIVIDPDIARTDLRAFKIELPATSPEGSPTGLLSTTFADGNKLFKVALDPEYWKLMGVVVKGSANFNLYDYTGLTNSVSADESLHSPLVLQSNSKRNFITVPEISHVTVCYAPNSEPPAGEGNGCTPGYWRNHADRWTGVTQYTTFQTAFNLSSPPAENYGTASLGQIISAPQTYGTFAYHAVAALLNAYGGVPNVSNNATVSYFKTPEEVQTEIQNALLYSTQSATKDLLAGQNEKGCPLSGTRAVKVTGTLMAP